MKTSKKIFRPDWGGNHGLGERFDLNADTPRGLFLADQGNRYLVCDHPRFRFAVALQHDDLGAFSIVQLRDRIVETGKWLGVGYIRLEGERPRHPNDEVDAGHLVVGRELAGLVTTDRLGTALKPLLHGRGGGRVRSYEHWTMLAEDESVFFSHSVR